MSVGAVTRIASGLAFLEGPRWHKNRLYVSDMYLRQVMRLTSTGQLQKVCDVPGRPSGLAWDNAGALLISSMEDRCVLRYQEGALEVFVDLSSVVPGDINDMVADGRGGVYVGNFGFDAERGETLRPTSLIHVSAAGTVQPVAEDLVFPNGMAVTPDRKTLLVAETFAFRISAYNIAPNGSLSERRTWASFSKAPVDLDMTAALTGGHIAPDGICLDAENAIWIGDAAGEGAVRVAEGGQILERVETPGASVFAVALGGNDGRTLYMCSAPKLGTFDLETSRSGRLLSVGVATASA